MPKELGRGLGRKGEVPSPKSAVKGGWNGLRARHLGIFIYLKGIFNKSVSRGM